jgi:hypothetical protein
MIAVMLALLPIALLIAILIAALAILNATKSGFNEIIKGLEAITDRLDRPR